jgi:glyoxylate reductase
MSLPKAVVYLPLPGDAIERIAAVADLTNVAGQLRPQLLAALAEAEGLLCSNHTPVDDELFDAAPRLRVISQFGVGYDRADIQEATARGIAISNTPDVLTDAVADLTLGLMLAASRRIPAYDRFVRSGEWGKRSGPPNGFDLRGKVLGIVGFGRIGRAVAARGSVFGLQILFHDVFTNPGSGEDARYRTLDSLLQQADIVSMHTNLDATSRHIISDRELRLMKPAAWIINTSRGPVIDEPALAAALHAGVIAGAALDVMEVEPLPDGAPMLAAPNTILTPHIASGTVETIAAMRELCLQNFINGLSGKRPPAVVNPEALERALVRR